MMNSIISIYDKIALEKQRRTPQIGDVYYHFKDIRVVVVALAMNTETQEPVVVYRHGDEYWARPLDMFLSEVDKIKYPACLQKYRFERELPANVTKSYEYQSLHEELKKLYNWSDIDLENHILDHYFK